MPKTSFISKLIPSLTITILLLNLLAPVGIAFAQDGSPPPEPPPTEEVAAEEQPGEEEESPAPEAEQPADEEAEVQEEADEGNEPEAETDEAPAGEAETQEEATEEQASEESQAASEESPVEADEAGPAEEEEPGTEENLIAEAVQALDEADAVLLDENGEPLSMASQETADTLSAPDPQFCPAGLSFGDTGCGLSHATMADAIADALTAAGSGISGTIYVEAGSFTGFTLSGFTFGTSLTIQGNADNGGTTNFTSAAIVDNTNTSLNLTFNDLTFDAGVAVLGATGDLSFNDVIANNAGGDGIEVTNHDGAVSLDNVTANNTGGDGADIQHALAASTQTVSVTNSSFNGNADEGLQIAATGSITLNNVNANNNLGANGGAFLGNLSLTSDPSITVTNGTFTGNTNGDGLGIIADGAVTLTNITATGNGDDGVEVVNDTGFLSADANVTITGGTFNNNGDDGLEVDSFGQITITNVTANGNGGGNAGEAGLDLDNTNSASDTGIILTNVTAEMNANDGIKGYSDGAITLNNVNANFNDDDGAELWNDFDMMSDAYVNVFNSNFNGNGATAVDGLGLDIHSFGAVMIDSVNSNNNADIGVHVDTLGTVTISNTNANFNDQIGLYVEDSEHVTLTNVDTISNGLAGADVSAAYGVSIFNSNFNDNGDSSSPVGLGLLIITGGDVTLDEVSASGNTSDSNTTGADILGAGSLTISNSLFNNNVGSGDVAGLSVQAGGDLTLESVQANQNVGTGVGSEVQGAILGNFFSGTNSNVVIKDSSFNGNSGGGDTSGLVVLSDGAITLKNVSASDNTSANGNATGAELDNAFFGTDVDAQVTVVNSQFNSNAGLTDGVGLLVYSQGTIHLWGVNADGNSVDGVDLQIDSFNGPHNTSIICSSMQINGEVGILVDGQGGDLNIFSTDTSGNGLSALDIINVTNTSFGTVNCDPDKDDHRDGKHAPLDPKDPTTIVLDLYPHSVTFPPMNLLECAGFVKSLFYMSDLPNEVPEGDDFLRAMKIRLEGCEIPDDGMFTIGFDIPAAEQGNEFAVLFWDSDTDSWIEIPGQLTEDGRYTVSWPETGTFVLVTR